MQSVGSSLHMHWVFLVCCPLPSLWYWLPTADVPLTGFLNCPHATATATLDSQCTLYLHLELLPLVTGNSLASPTVLSGALQITTECVNSPPPPTHTHTHTHTYCQVKDKVKVTLWPTVSLGVRRPSGTRDQFFFLLEIFFRQLWVCYFVASSLTRGWVCNLLLLLVLASAVPLGSALSDERSGLSFVSISLWSVTMYIRYIYKASFSPGSVQQIMH
jgi:hypothetical protein